MWNEEMDTSMSDASIDNVKNIVPMINKHILALKETPKGYKLWGFPVKIVQICGVLKSVNIEEIRGTYIIEDFSGEITVIRYFGEENKHSQHQTNTYVEVSGFLRDQKDQRFIAAAYEPRPIESVNYINTHYLSAIYAWSRFKSMRDEPSSVTDDTVMNETNAVETGNVSAFLMNQVLDYLRADNSLAGLRVEDIAKGLNLNPSVLKSVMESLSNEGHVYSTINEFHFKATQ